MNSVWMGAAASLVAVAAHAQVAPAPAPVPTTTGRATITGVVVDSLHASYLVGAEVMVEGAKSTTQTDSLGRFRIDGLVPGTYQVGVFHPLLDTLDMSLATRPFHVGADSVSIVQLGVPSAKSLIARMCEVRPRSQGTSAVMGRVVDPETLQPVPNVDVTIAWTEIEATKAFGVRQTPRLVRDSTDALGRFRVCGLPSSLNASLQAQRGTSQTAQVGIVLGDAPTELFLRTLLLSPTDSTATTGSAVVSGRVVLEGSASGAGTRVELAGTPAVTITDEKGEFTLRNLPSGTRVVVARHLGFAADAVEVDLSSREPKNITIRLPKYVTVMDPVLVTARRTAALDKVGFARRQRSGGGYFVGPDRLAKMRPNELTDILRTIPGLRVEYGQGGETVTTTRGATSLTGRSCVQYYVDDMPWQAGDAGDVNMFVSAREVVAVEVYHGTSTPPQYTGLGMGNCSVIVLWTRMRIRD